MALRKGKRVRLKDSKGRIWTGHIHRVSEIDDSREDGTVRRFDRYVATVQFVTPTTKECKQ